MSTYMMILTIVCMGILVFSLGYTLSIAKGQKDMKGSFDSSIPQKVQKHPYIRNPIYLSYGIFFALLILTILYFALWANG